MQVFFFLSHTPDQITLKNCSEEWKVNALFQFDSVLLQNAEILLIKMLKVKFVSLYSVIRNSLNS